MKKRKIKSIGFFGISEYGMHFLDSLCNSNYEVKFVTGKSKMTPHTEKLEKDLKQFCSDKKIDFYGNVNANSDEMISHCKNVDLCIIGGYDKILKKDVLSAPKYGFINTHLGLIPYNRGCNPVMWSILKGIPQAATTYHVGEEIDLGKIIDIQNFDYDKNMTAYDAYQKMSLSVGQRILDIIEKFESCETVKSPSESDYHKSGMPNNSCVSWYWSNEFIKKFSNALCFPPYKPMHTILDGRKVFITIDKTEISENNSGVEPGNVIEKYKNGFIVSTLEGQAYCKLWEPHEIKIGDAFSFVLCDRHPIEKTYANDILPSVFNQRQKIPIFNLEFEDDFIEKFKKGAEDILKSDGLSENNWVKKFEKKFSDLVKCKHAVAVTSGTAALEVALKSVNVFEKDVILPSNTFFATSIAVTNSGGRIVLADIEKESFALCPDDLEKKINKNTAAVVLVHIGGIISRHAARIKDICNKHDVFLIEDAAHAHCSNKDGLYAGTIGDVGCFSFFPTKVMTTGEGGMVTTNSDSLWDKIRSIKNFGRDNNDPGICVRKFGQNSKINEFTGLLGYLECDRVKERIEKRNKLVERYVKNLKGTHYKVVLQKGGSCSYYKCIVRTDIDQSRLKKYCKERSVSLTGEVYSIPVHHQPMYKKEFASYNLPVTEEVCKSHVCPPLYPELTNEEIDYVCEVLKSAERDLK